MFRADYLGPDRRRHAAPNTFGDEASADAWLAKEKALIDSGDWLAPDLRLRAQPADLASFAWEWIETEDLKDTTRTLYGRCMDDYVLPHLGHVPIERLKQAMFVNWYRTVGPRIPPRVLEQCEATLHAMLNTAVLEDRIDKNPCKIPKRYKAALRKERLREAARAAAQDETEVAVEAKREILTPKQVADVARAMATVDDEDAIRAAGDAALAEAIATGAGARARDAARRRAERAARREHRGINKPQWTALILLACWGAMRTAELQALQRRHIDLARGVVHIKAAAFYVRPDRRRGTPGRWDVGEVKAESQRAIEIPPHIRADLERHLELHVGPKSNDLVFPGEDGGFLGSSSFFNAWKEALSRAGANDIPFHWLRHTGASLRMQAGATLAEVMEVLGHGSTQVAMSYQHSTQARQRLLADRVSQFALAAEQGADHRAA